ncbi:transposase (plasmid) [Pontibacillus sp. ALD_SL1]|uniref:transposase n=1 Tax=Pontibacillus sp. ALD_SL1 TaxID=2777185 RepID=UPI001A964A95|nr:transposase [Pontibacillus sp. ALD_SL1]QST02496.1 transposase [Pontibacillus sp. ALD_SL1]
MAEAFVFEQELKTNNNIEKEINTRLEIGRQIRNTVLSILLKQHKQMIRTKKYQKYKRQLSAVLKKLSQAEKKNDKKSKEEKRILKQDLYHNYEQLNDLRNTFGLTKVDAEKYATPVRNHFYQEKINKKGKTVFKEILDANTAQKMAERAWVSYKKYLTKQSKKVCFKKIDEVHSIEGKTNKQGIRFINNQVYLTANLSIPIIQKPHDMYANEILSDIQIGVRKVKYCRIIRKVIRGKNRYFVQLVLEGVPPIKRCSKTGSFNRILGQGNVGIDIGTQNVAVVSKEKILLKDLSPKTNPLGRQLWLIERKMDRSKRSTNPKNYNDNGTLKKGKKDWAYSNRYKKLRDLRKELHRKQADIRKQSHNRDTNVLLSFGDTFYVETMNFKGLQKKSSKTEKNKKGKFKRKKRFGKSIGNKAPSMFLTLLEQKLEALEGNYKEINTWTFKASQYDHIKDEFIKKKLSTRWHLFENGTKIQRDLYSVFLLMNSKANGKTTDRNLCVATFDEFEGLHDVFIQQIKKDGRAIKNSGIVTPV